MSANSQPRPTTWTITSIMYLTVTCIIATGILYECGLSAVAGSIMAVAVILFMVAMLKYLNGDHLR